MAEDALEVDEFVRRIRERADARVWDPPVPEVLTRSLQGPRIQDHAGLDYAHRRWALPDGPAPGERGRGSRLRRRLGQVVFGVLARYLHDERELISHLVQLNDALAKRCDELAEAHRLLLDELDVRFADAAAAQGHLVRSMGSPKTPDGANGGV